LKLHGLSTFDAGCNYLLVGRNLIHNDHIPSKDIPAQGNYDLQTEDMLAGGTIAMLLDVASTGKMSHIQAEVYNNMDSVGDMGRLDTHNHNFVCRGIAIPSLF